MLMVVASNPSADKPEDWFILRTSGRSTLLLAKTLEEDGFEVWTPARTQTVRIPRMNVRREIILPLLPSFVFVRARHLHEMLELAKMAVKPRRSAKERERHTQPAHRSFGVFHYLDQIPMIADRHLEPLRVEEEKAAYSVSKKLQPFERGSKVRVARGAFEGLRGRVERCKSGHALVIFTDWKRPVKIPTWLLKEDEAIMASKVARAA